MKTFFLFFIFSCAGILPATAENDHDIHLSICELRFNEKSASFEVAIKIFIDDLEKAIQQNGPGNLRIGTSQESSTADEAIAYYLDRNFTIEIDGVKLKPDFIGKEITEDMLAVWCYIEYPQLITSGKKCLLSNNILLDIYEDQRNIMDIRMSKTHKDYTILASGKNTWVYHYQQ